MLPVFSLTRKFEKSTTTCDYSAFISEENIFSEAGKFTLQLSPNDLQNLKNNEKIEDADTSLQTSPSFTRFLKLPTAFIQSQVRNRCEETCFFEIANRAEGLDEIYATLGAVLLRSKQLGDLIEDVKSSSAGVCGPISMAGHNDQLHRLPALEQEYDTLQTNINDLKSRIEACTDELIHLGNECSRYAEMNFGMGQELKSNPSVTELAAEKMVLSNIQKLLASRIKACTAVSEEYPALNGEDWRNAVNRIQHQIQANPEVRNHFLELTSFKSDHPKRNLAALSNLDISASPNKRLRSDAPEKSILVPSTAPEIKPIVDDGEHASDSGEISQTDPKKIDSTNNAQPDQFQVLSIPFDYYPEEVVVNSSGSDKVAQVNPTESGSSRTTLSAISCSLFVNLSNCTPIISPTSIHNTNQYVPGSKENTEDIIEPLTGHKENVVMQEIEIADSSLNSSSGELPHGTSKETFTQMVRRTESEDNKVLSLEEELPSMRLTPDSQLESDDALGDIVSEILTSGIHRSDVSNISPQSDLQKVKDGISILQGWKRGEEDGKKDQSLFSGVTGLFRTRSAPARY